MLRPSADSAGVAGAVFTNSEAELAAEDVYEVSDYARVLVLLRSGDQAWVYVLASTTADMAR